MEFPWICGTCSHENMIDLEHLSEWPLDKIVTAQGFTCKNCGIREAISYQTTSLKEAEGKMTRCKPGTQQFQWLFHKLLKKAEGVNARGAQLGIAMKNNS